MMATAFLALGILATIVVVAVGWALIERWMDRAPARRRRGLQVDHEVQVYMRRRSDAQRRAVEDARAREAKREG